MCECEMDAHGLFHTLFRRCGHIDRAHNQLSAVRSSLDPYFGLSHTLSRAVVPLVIMLMRNVGRFS